MNVTVLVVPVGVVTPMLRAPVVAVLVTLRVALIVVPVPFTTKVPGTSETPPVSPVSAVDPVRPTPVRTTGTERLPVAG